MHKTICALILALATAITIAAPLTAQMMDYGTYEVDRGSKESDGQVAGGLVVSHGNKLVAATTEIDATIGTTFGFRYILRGQQNSANLRIRVVHPKALKDPATGKLFETSEWSQRVPVNKVNWNTGWSFDNRWELVPGAWKIQLYGDDGLLLEKNFMVRVK